MEIKPEPLDLEDLADEIIRVEYPTYEQATNPQMKNSIIREKQQIKFILEQRLKSVCEFWLRYKDNPELFCKEQFKIRWEYYLDIGYLVWNISKKQWENYNEWLFKLAFRGIWNEERLRR